MFFMMGIMPGRKDFEYNRLMTCPICGAYGRYMVYMTYNVLSLFFIPVFKWGRRYFVETSCCHTVYELDPEFGKSIARGDDIEIYPQNIRKTGTKGFGVTQKRCGNCGFTTVEDYEFCPKCGNRLL